mgnify:CR=1 FL=1
MDDALKTLRLSVVPVTVVTVVMMMVVMVSPAPIAVMMMVMVVIIVGLTVPPLPIAVMMMVVMIVISELHARRLSVVASIDRLQDCERIGYRRKQVGVRFSAQCISRIGLSLHNCRRGVAHDDGRNGTDNAGDLSRHLTMLLDLPDRSSNRSTDVDRTISIYRCGQSERLNKAFIGRSRIYLRQRCASSSRAKLRRSRHETV